jgi:hypothetical protein
MTTEAKEKKDSIEILNRDLFQFLTSLHGKRFMEKRIEVSVTSFEPEIVELKFWGHLSRNMRYSL